jgi:hypothetical protein
VNLSQSKLDLLLGLGIILMVGAIILNHRRSLSLSQPSPVSLGVEALIEKVKEELISAEERRLTEGAEPLLKLKAVDLEVNFIVEENRKGSGAVDLKVVTVGGESAFGSERTQKVILHLVAAKSQTREESASDVPVAVDESTVLRGKKPPK